MFAEEARLAPISRGLSDPCIDPKGEKPSCLHTAVHRDLNEPTEVYCHHSPKRKDSKLPCQELWPSYQYNTQPLSLILPVNIKGVTKGTWCNSILATK